MVSSCLHVALQVPWIQVSRSSSLLLMVKPTVFLLAILMGMYVTTLVSRAFMFSHSLIRLCEETQKHDYKLVVT